MSKLDKADGAALDKLAPEKPAIILRRDKPKNAEFSNLKEGQQVFVKSEKRIYFRAYERIYYISATEV